MSRRLSSGTNRRIKVPKHVALVQRRDDEEGRVQHKGDDGVLPVQPPRAQDEGEVEQDDHGKQEQSGVGEGRAVDDEATTWAEAAVHQGLDEPGQAEAEEDVEDVAAEKVAEGHVA